MKLRLVSFACVALALFCAPSRPVASSAIRVAGGLDSAPLRTGGFTADAPPIASESSIAYFDTLAQFKARSSLPAGVTHVYVRAVTGNYPPPAGADATPLWYKAASSATGVWGEVKVGGQIFDPVYSTNPVNIGEFGLVADGAWRQGGCNFTATSAGGETLTVSSTAGCVAGMRLTSVNWATRAAASLPIVPPGTTLSAIGPGKIAVSHRVPAMNAVPLAAWWDDVTGTDNAPAIQAALDFGMRNRYPHFKFPNGVFAVKSSLNAGWGKGYYTLNIKGGDRNSFAGLPGTVLLFTQFNQPFMNFQAVRTSSLAGVAIIGRNYNYLAYGQGRPSFSPNRNDWVAPEFSPASAPGGLQANAPFAGVTEDAYCGGAPAIPYPNRSYPAWTGLSAQYGFDASSDLKLDDMEIDGFGVAFANGVNCGANGDFTKITNLRASKNAYVVAVTQTESRNVELRNLIVERHYAAVTNSAFGSGTGAFNGPMVNISSGGGYEMFEFHSMAYAEPVIIDNIYAEDIVRIGDFTNTLAFPSPVIFRGGHIYTYNLHGQYASSLITNSGPVIFSGFNITGSNRISLWSVGGGSIKFADGGSWQCAYAAAPTTAAQLLAVNYSGGCLAYNAYFQDPVVATNWTGVGGTLSSSALQSQVSLHNRRIPMTQGMTQIRDQDNRVYNITQPATNLIDTSVSSVIGTASSITNDVMTFGYCSARQARLPLYTGAILLNANASAVFVVASVGIPVANANCSDPNTAVTITTQQQNNLNVIPGTDTFLSNNITGKNVTGYLIQIPGVNLTMPGHLYFGDFTSGSPTVASVRDAGGSGASIASAISTGDLFLGPGVQNYTSGGYSAWGASGIAWPIPAGVGLTISAITDGVPGSITLSGNARSTGTFPIFPLELRP
jgi:hypothetical protein